MSMTGAAIEVRIENQLNDSSRGEGGFGSTGV